MKFSTIIKHSAELSRIIVNSSSPADSLASEYLRSKKYIGSNDRKLISEIVFSNLRVLTLAEQAISEFLFVKKIDSLSKDDILILNILSSIIINDALNSAFLSNINANLAKLGLEFASLADIITNVTTELAIDAIVSDDLFAYLSDFTNTYIENINADSKLKPSELCLSETVINSLSKRYDNAFIKSLSSELMRSAPLCIRVNTLIASLDDILEKLSDNEIIAKKSTLSSAGIIIPERVNLSNYDFFKDGSIEVQDIGSQLISYALDPEEDSRILDACAGAGGKTLHLAALTNDNAEITATDTEYKRLKEISIRANKAGISSITPIVIKENQLKTQVNRKFQHILIDAPCSGLGTVRRMPMQKYRLNDKLLKRICKNQLEILEYYSQFLANSGTLVYATCSLLPDENDEIIGRFLSEHPEFAPVPLSESFNRFGISIPNLKDDAFSLALTPLNGETDGFFMAKIQKVV